MRRGSTSAHWRSLSSSAHDKSGSAPVARPAGRRLRQELTGAMNSDAAPHALVVIAGPQASGKSTLATALGAELRRCGELVALVELDQIAAMALPTLPNWAVAHAIFESVTGQWTRADLTCVIAEGSGSQDEVARLRAQARASAVVVVVAVTTPFLIAFARAQRDQERGVSREYGFLSAVYERWPDEMALMDADVVIDTEERSVEQGVALVRAAIKDARADGRQCRSRSHEQN